MSKKSTELLALYEALITQVKSDYSDDNTMTVKKLFNIVTSSKEYLSLKDRAKANELALVEQFLKRDIAAYLQEKNDTDLSHSPTMITVESTLWHWLSGITDRSQIEWHEVIQDFKHQGHYMSGEIVGQGIMVCTNCGHEMRIEFPGVIPDCPQCDKGEFTREALAP
ncbi:protein of unknown function DUF1451 [Shewanella sediminis HAW-EB3]|uniref:Zinc ribbon-containing protein n=1 Tax=Shewanella sediminis (strain HAW-EB3) TaxID=425104 RepID=A8FZ09_SHESH|nr:zinc ribbon-containing protein [Shewanella sediminis]ABV38082.1 protein of unknown function DUF1451 [Shewanella sediminis HAW-EB3]